MIGIGLHYPKNHLNVGSTLRAAFVFNADLVAISGQRYHRASTDTMKAYRHVPLIHVENILDAIPFDCVPVAVDILPRATMLPKYVHPKRAFYIFGPEDGTLGKNVVDRCRDVITVPTNQELCLNLAATVNVVLYDRRAKEARQFRETDAPMSALSLGA